MPHRNASGIAGKYSTAPEQGPRPICMVCLVIFIDYPGLGFHRGHRGPLEAILLLAHQWERARSRDQDSLCRSKPVPCTQTAAEGEAPQNQPGLSGPHRGVGCGYADPELRPPRRWRSPAAGDVAASGQCRVRACVPEALLNAGRGAGFSSVIQAAGRTDE